MGDVMMGRRLTTGEFISKARVVHGDKFDYSKVDYVNNSTNITIICPEHGEFEQTPAVHLRSNYGCQICSGRCVYDTKSFIKKAREVHGNKYDYSKVDYVNSATNVCIMCSKHGEFWQTPDNHTSGSGCRECGLGNISNKLRYSTDKFIMKARMTHGDRYDYSKVVYVNSDTKVCIICMDHGSFWQIAHHHSYGSGCPKCKAENTANRYLSNVNEFIRKAKTVHGDLYWYDKVRYVDSSTNVCIMCSKHGEFWQTPGNHLDGKGCCKCGRERAGIKCRNVSIASGLGSYSKHSNRLLPSDGASEGEYGELLVTCVKCKTLFVPNRRRVEHRIRAIESVNEGYGEAAFYCSDACKDACLSFGRKLYPKGHEGNVKTARGCQSKSKLILLQLQIDECGYNYCERCQLEVRPELHHTIEVAKDPLGSITTAGHMLLCIGCHRQYTAECR